MERKEEIMKRRNPIRLRNVMVRVWVEAIKLGRFEAISSSNGSSYGTESSRNLYNFKTVDSN